MLTVLSACGFSLSLCVHVHAYVVIYVQTHMFQRLHMLGHSLRGSTLQEPDRRPAAFLLPHFYCIPTRRDCKIEWFTNKRMNTVHWRCSSCPSPRWFESFTLFQVLGSGSEKQVCLAPLWGCVVHTWTTSRRPAIFGVPWCSEIVHQACGLSIRNPTPPPFFFFFFNYSLSIPTHL